MSNEHRLLPRSLCFKCEGSKYKTEIKHNSNTFTLLFIFFFPIITTTNKNGRQIEIIPKNHSINYV